MDTRSSSGSGSHSANVNPILSQDRPRAPQHATYTTAGTVYNPQTAPALQPPARRGRASRWPPAIPADLSAFNSSVLGPFPRTRYHSPPTTASTLRHYSPLQQNQDRAIDPRLSADHHRPATSLSSPKRSASGNSSNMSISLSNLSRELLAEGVRKSIFCNDCGEQFQTVALAEFHTSLSGHDNFSETSEDNSHPDGGTVLQDKETKEEEDLTQFNNYSVKTLTNLASYPNPNQKMAQRCLDRARETFKAAADNLRSASPNRSRPGFSGADASFSSYLSGTGCESSEYYSRVPRNAHMNSSTRASVLSSGPGAPQPLTAGPPGQRHYKASTLEGPLRSLQESAPKPYSLTKAESLLSTNPPNLSAVSILGRSLSTKMPEASHTSEREMKAPRPRKDPVSPYPAEQSALGAARSASETAFRESTCQDHTVLPNQMEIRWNEVRETKAPDELREYYHKSLAGLPCDYNPATLVSVPDDNSDLQPPPGRVLPSILEVRSQRDADLAQHRESFYAGDAQMFRPWEHRYDEIRAKARDWELGLHNERGPLTLAQIEAAVDPSQIGKPRNISVNLINQLQSHDAVRPLLPMLYSTLANLKNNLTGFQRTQKPKKDDRKVCSHPFGYIGQEREERMRAQAERAQAERAQADRAHRPTPSRGENHQW